MRGFTQNPPGRVIALLALGALSQLFAAACVSVRGEVAGIVADGAGGESIPGLELYHYIKVRTRWPFQEDPASGVRVMRARRTGPYGDFTLERSVLWLIPFVQRVEEEQLILNLDLRPDMKERIIAEGIYTHFWKDPLYARRPDARFPGLIVNLRRSLFGPHHPLPPRLPYIPGHRFISLSTDQRRMGRIVLPRAVTMEQDGRDAPEPPIAPEDDRTPPLGWIEPPPSPRRP